MIIKLRAGHEIKEDRLDILNYPVLKLYLNADDYFSSIDHILNSDDIMMSMTYRVSSSKYSVEAIYTMIFIELSRYWMIKEIYEKEKNKVKNIDIEITGNMAKISENILKIVEHMKSTDFKDIADEIEKELNETTPISRLISMYYELKAIYLVTKIKEVEPYLINIGRRIAEIKRLMLIRKNNYEPKQMITLSELNSLYKYTVDNIKTAEPVSHIAYLKTAYINGLGYMNNLYSIYGARDLGKPFLVAYTSHMELIHGKGIFDKIADMLSLYTYGMDRYRSSVKLKVGLYVDGSSVNRDYDVRFGIIREDNNRIVSVLHKDKRAYNTDKRVISYAFLNDDKGIPVNIDTFAVERRIPVKEAR